MALTPYQEATLTSGGDCFDHWHSTDRALSHDDVLAYQGLTLALEITGDHTVDNRGDFLLVDSSAGNVVITLPVANNGREIEVMKNASANYVSIVPAAGELILDSTEVRIFNYGTSLRFKAIPGGWFII